MNSIYQPEVEFVLNQKEALPVALSTIERHLKSNGIHKTKSAIHKNLTTAIRRGLIYQPVRGEYAKRQLNRNLIFHKPIEQYVIEFSHTFDPIKLMDISRRLRQQADDIDEYLKLELSDNPVPLSRMFMSGEWLVKPLRAKKSTENESDRELDT